MQNIEFLKIINNIFVQKSSFFYNKNHVRFQVGIFSKMFWRKARSLFFLQFTIEMWNQIFMLSSAKSCRQFWWEGAGNLLAFWLDVYRRKFHYLLTKKILRRGDKNQIKHGIIKLALKITKNWFLLKNDVNRNFFHQHHLLYNQY